MFSPKWSRWPRIFFAFLTSLTHHLSMLKFSEKNQCQKTFARTSLKSSWRQLNVTAAELRGFQNPCWERFVSKKGENLCCNRQKRLFLGFILNSILMSQNVPDKNTTELFLCMFWPPPDIKRTRPKRKRFLSSSRARERNKCSFSLERVQGASIFKAWIFKLHNFFLQ